MTKQYGSIEKRVEASAEVKAFMLKNVSHLVTSEKGRLNLGLYYFGKFNNRTNCYPLTITVELGISCVDLKLLKLYSGDIYSASGGETFQGKLEGCKDFFKNFKISEKDLLKITSYMEGEDIDVGNEFLPRFVQRDEQGLFYCIHEGLYGAELTYSTYNVDIYDYTTDEDMYANLESYSN